MRLECDETGDLWLRGMSVLHTATLRQVPDWLQSEDPRVRARLLPEVYDDHDEEQQWRRHGASQLEHLFASRAEILTQDLRGLARDGDLTYCLRIPRNHAAAWLSSLNAARLALFELHDLSGEDLEVDPIEIDDPEKELALIRIHLMAFTQELLLGPGL